MSHQSPLKPQSRPGVEKSHGLWTNPVRKSPGASQLRDYSPSFPQPATRDIKPPQTSKERSNNLIIKECDACVPNILRSWYVSASSSFVAEAFLSFLSKRGPIGKSAGKCGKEGKESPHSQWYYGGRVL